MMRSAPGILLLALTLTGCSDGAGPEAAWKLALTVDRLGVPRIALANGDASKVRVLDGVDRESAAAWSPDGTKLAFVRENASDADLWIRDVRTGDVTRVTNTPDAAEYDPSWSPDGRRLAYTRFGTDGGIWTIGVDGSGAARLASGTDGDWGPDGRVAFAAPFHGTVHIWAQRPGDANAQQVTLDDGYMYRAPDWGPDGRLAFVRRDFCCGDPPRHTIMVTETGTLKPREIVSDSAGFTTIAWSPDATQLVLTRIRFDDVGLWTVPVSGGRLRRLTRASASVAYSQASWAPAP